MEPATIILVATTVAGAIWGYLERRAKNISKAEQAKLENDIAERAKGGYTSDEVIDTAKDILNYSRD